MQKELESDIEDLKALLEVAKRDYSKSIINRELDELDKKLKIVF